MAAGCFSNQVAVLGVTGKTGTEEQTFLQLVTLPYLRYSRPLPQVIKVIRRR